MKKIRWATHKTLFAQIATSTCLIGGAAGLIFGVSAGTFKVSYFNLNSINTRFGAAVAKSTNYYSQNISSQWNMNTKGELGKAGYIPGYDQPTEPTITTATGAKWWKGLHGDLAVPLCEDWNGVKIFDMNLGKERGTETTSGEAAVRRKYATLIIDGATHTAMDRSFNQSLYTGIVNFIKNKTYDVKKDDEAQVYKPSQDSTQEFVNVYREAAKNSRILCLAGFNHVTPLNALGKQIGSKVDFGTDEYVKNAGMLLIDGDISNNQNMASVLFRSDQPAFLTGVATCMYFMNNLEIYHENFRDISVAAYGGTAIPTVSIYMGGFQRGVEFFNEFVLKNKILKKDFNSYLDDPTYTLSGHAADILKASKYKEQITALAGTAPEQEVKDEVFNRLYQEFSIKMIKLGAFNTHFSGSFAAGDAIGISKQLLNRGASAIIAVAGPQSLDTAQEIMNQKSKCIVIGVDCPMENSDYQKPFVNPNFKDRTVAPDGSKSAQADKIIKFSAVKDMTSVSEKIIRLAGEGKNWDVTNKKPWKTTATIPSWKAEDEISQKWIACTKNADGTTYDIIGLSSYASGPKVLRLPTKKLFDGELQERTLNKIRQPNTTELQQGGIFPFNATTLNGIHTLKIDGDETSNFTLADKAFDYSVSGIPGQEQPSKEEDLKTSGFKYIDLTAIPAANILCETNAYPFYGIDGFKTAFSYNKGVAKFKPKTDDLVAQALLDRLFPHDSTTYASPWSIVEADPYKSICTFGFKTCGNIENGLISISWDGWEFLIDALKELEYCDLMSDHPGIPVDFLTIFKRAAQQYKDDTAADPSQPTAFLDWVIDTDPSTGATLNDLLTFKKDSKFYINYSHTMAILGRLLNRAALTFSKDMTVILNDAGQPTKPASDTEMPILEWLKSNMYFTV